MTIPHEAVGVAPLSQAEEAWEKYGVCKVNLIHIDGSEGIWAAPADAQSKARLSDDRSDGEAALVYLVNQPICWGEWGKLITVTTNGHFRATFHVPR